MKSEVKDSDYSVLSDRIDEEIVQIIAKSNILYFMAEGVVRENERMGMALEEMSQQLDHSARRLLELWENIAQHMDKTCPQAPVKPSAHEQSGNIHLHG